MYLFRNGNGKTYIHACTWFSHNYYYYDHQDDRWNNTLIIIIIIMCVCWLKLEVKIYEKKTKWKWKNWPEFSFTLSIVIVWNDNFLIFFFFFFFFLIFSLYTFFYKLLAYKWTTTTTTKWIDKTTTMCRYIKMSSPYLNNLIIIGCILTYTSVILLGLNSGLTSENNFPYICAVCIWMKNKKHKHFLNLRLNSILYFQILYRFSIRIRILLLCFINLFKEKKILLFSSSLLLFTIISVLFCSWPPNVFFVHFIFNYNSHLSTHKKKKRTLSFCFLLYSRPRK